MAEERARPDYDQALKAMLERAPQGFAALLKPDVTWNGALSPELPATERRADLVWDVTFGGGERGILHIELQTKVEDNIGLRLAEYSLRVFARDALPVYSVVVFLRPTANMPQSPFEMRCAGQARHTFVYDVVRIWELPPELVLDTSYYALWPLAALMANASIESTVAVAERIADAPLARHEQSELSGLLTILAGMRLPRKALNEALGRSIMLKGLLEESSFAEVMRDLLYDELTAEGKAKGLAEGEAKGRAEGEANAAREMARIALEGRFGALSEDIVAALANADQTACTAIVAHITMDTLEEARARLGLGLN